MNKIYTIEYKGESMIGTSFFVVVVVAASGDIAREYVKNKIGIDAEPTCLVNATYPTIYVRDGSVPERIQAKILYNGNCHY